MDTKTMTEDDWTQLHEMAATVFTPSAPIDTVDFFAGRWSQLTAIKDAVITKGQHAIVFGERGVGKTSLVSVVGALMEVFKVEIPIVVRQNCGQEDNFGKVWKRAFRDVAFEVKRNRLGFADDVITETVSLAERVSNVSSADEIISVLRNLRQKLVFVFDEFDQLIDKPSKKTFADTVKALSDYAVSSTVIMVGVGDDVAALLESHASVERALVQIQVPRMAFDELEEILTKVPSKLGVKFDADASHRVVRFSQGLPHYVHMIGLHATRAAIKRRTLSVSVGDVDNGAAAACNKVSKSILDAYQTAVDSPQRDALFKYVLLACALTPPDERGSFAPGDVRPALRGIGQELEIPAYARHLHKFASAERGDILQKTGPSKRHRYRFRNPLMQPYVVMRGVADKLTTMHHIEGFIAPHRLPDKDDDVPF